MKNKRTPTKSTKTPKRERTTNPDPGTKTPRRFLKLAIRDRERLKEVYGPKNAPLIEAAGDLIARTEFGEEGNWRKIPTLNVEEIDFRSLKGNQLDFAVFWEHAREIRALYHEIEIPVPVEGPNALPWIKLNSFFPIPISRLVSHNLLKTSDSDEEGLLPEDFAKPSPGFYELDPTLMMDLFKNLSRDQKNAKGGASWAREKTSSELNRLKDEIIGIGPADFSKTLEFLSKSPDAFRSFHSMGIDWSRGISAIKSDFNRWVDERFENFATNSSASVFKEQNLAITRRLEARKDELHQLGAWRAKRAGMDAKQFLQYRVEAFLPDFTFPSGVAVGGAERMKAKANALAHATGWPKYSRNQEFNEAVAAAESRLATYASNLARFAPSNATVSVPEQEP